MGAFARAEPGLSLGKLVQVHVSVRSSSLVVYLKETTKCCMLGGAHTPDFFKEKCGLGRKGMHTSSLRFCNRLRMVSVVQQTRLSSFPRPRGADG